MRILLIEDNENIGNAVRDHMTAHGFEIDWMLDLKTAFSTLKGGEQYALILLDLHLPDGSGLMLLEWLRNRNEPLPPVMILSAYDQVSDRMEGLKLGAVDYLVKPFDLDELISRSHMSIAKSHKLRSPRLVA